MKPSSTPSRALGLFSAIAVLFTGTSSALRVTPGSACASYCLDNGDNNGQSANSTTTPSDIVCNDTDYWSTTVGTRYRNCLTCLQNSTAVNGLQSDVEWYLYNVRYAVDVCLFSSPGPSSSNSSTSSPCVLSGNCPSLQKALDTGNVNPSNETQYQYCTADGGVFGGTTLSNCAQCLQTNSEQTYLSNFLTALSAGCKQKPPQGDLLGLNGTLFSTTAMTIVTPSWNQTSPGQATSVTKLTTGTIVGIVVAGALLLLSAAVLFFLHWRKQRVAKMEPFYDDRYGSDQFRPVKSISSSFSGGTAPMYTTDYKSPPADRRNFELYDKIKTQHVVIPERKPYEPGTAGQRTAALWGRDTPVPTRQQLLSPKTANTSMSQHTAGGDVNGPLDGMPTHPAFIPRAFTRASRNPMAQPEPKHGVKASKPDTYALQRYLDTVEDLSKVDVETLLSEPPAANAQNTRTTTVTVTSNPFATPEATPMRVPPPPPGPPPQSKPKANSSSKLTPSLATPPSLSRIRSPKMYIPPPLNITPARPKAQRVDSDSDEPK
ncbi:uncharacterized protein SPSK_04157 [Sporothrix schenckii 1099-18]|uniref:LPXTG-domain-containing protein n=1 Tax=Sporothrix schenckii 1099-18 TaxID=1397361 RepID=A0A0F2M6H6_SPOSC|nr:uncharacterized protein SPSK_04157 [Sporothrix schenckii 1099-18]KJR83786.1 hypothetical protein SPSK_04157 [Sporothrix schenckii 1099-18]